MAPRRAVVAELGDEELAARIGDAAVLGIDREAYYDQLCELADMVSTGIATMDPAATADEHDGCGGGGCSCG